MPIQLDQNFKEFLNLLQQHGAEYLLIGGYAVNFHGYVRYTGDMDIYVSLSAANAIRVAAALNELGFDEVNPEMFTKPSSMIRIGVAPTKLEVTNFIDGVTFEDCYANRLRVQIDGVDVNVMSLTDLRRNKRASGRLKDLADLEKLPES